jgi:hypothetical protein
MAKIIINFDTQNIEILEFEPDEKVFYNIETENNTKVIYITTIEEPEDGSI